MRNKRLMFTAIVIFAFTSFTGCQNKAAEVATTETPVATLIVEGNNTKETAEPTKKVVEKKKEPIDIKAVPNNMPNGIFTGISKNLKGDLGIIYVTINDGKAVLVDYHEIANAHYDKQMGKDKKGNEDFAVLMEEQGSSLNWEDIIEKMEKIVLESQGGTVEDIDTMTGATSKFNSDDMLLEAYDNAISVGYVDSGKTGEDSEKFTEIQSNVDDGVYMGAAQNMKGDLGLTSIVVENKKIMSLEYHEITNGFDEEFGGSDKKYGDDQKWIEEIKKLEDYVIENQTIADVNIFDIVTERNYIDSYDLFFESTIDAMTVAKTSSEAFQK